MGSTQIFSMTLMFTFRIFFDCRLYTQQLAILFVGSTALVPRCNVIGFHSRKLEIFTATQAYERNFERWSPAFLIIRLSPSQK